MRRHILPLILTSIVLAPLHSAQAQCSFEIKLNAPGLPEADRAKVLETLQADNSCSPTQSPDKALWMVHNLGYFKAGLTPSTTPASSPSTLTVEITPGSPYHFSGFTLHGNHVLTVAQLQADYALRPGDLLSHALLGKTLENIQKSYAGVGLMNEVTNPIAQINDETHTVTMDLQVDEGS